MADLCEALCLSWPEYNAALFKRRAQLLRQLRFINRELKAEDLPIGLKDRYKQRQQEINVYFAGGWD